MFAGSYDRLWTKHAGLDPAVCDALQNETPGYSLRMQEVTASALLPQVARLPVIHKIHVANWNRLRALIGGHAHVDVPLPHARATTFKDTMQFHLVGLTGAQAERFIAVMGAEGVKMQIFGRKRNARDFRSWRFLPAAAAARKPATVGNIEFACDLSLQPHLTSDDIDLLGEALLLAADYVTTGANPSAPPPLSVRLTAAAAPPAAAGGGASTE